MKKMVFAALLAIIGAVSLAAQGWGYGYGPNPGYAAQSVTVSGTLALRNGG